MEGESEGNVRAHEQATDMSEPGSQLSTTSGLVEPLALLHRPHRRRKTILIVGVLLATLDLCCLPITYYYALNFDTGMSLQDVFAVITGVYGLLSFTHYFFRSLKLFRPQTTAKWRPAGWTKWGLLEFLQVNILIIISLVEIELVVGTIPNNPIVRLCAMPSPTICFYIGFLFCITAILTQMKKKLPFHMSSSEKGSPWKPALFAFIEDAGAIEGQGGVEYRKQILKRYDMSPAFRRMILQLSWGWGIGLICIAIISTVLIMVLTVNVGFGVGWGLPWMFTAVASLVTVGFVKNSLRNERDEWRTKESASVVPSVA